MRVEQPFPGDLVIRARVEHVGPLPQTVFLVMRWPENDRVIAGPYQSFGYALRQAAALEPDWSVCIWRDHAGPNEPEQLEDVTPAQS